MTGAFSPQRAQRNAEKGGDALRAHFFPLRSSAPSAVKNPINGRGS
jgi:hypothetical protein